MISEYADIPYITTHRRNLERRAQATPTDPEGLATQQRLKETLKKKVRTLGEVAAGRLDEMHNLVVGKPAPTSRASTPTVSLSSCPTSGARSW